MTGARKKLLLLGGNILNSGFADYAQRRGLDLVVVDWNEHVDWISPDQHIRADIKDPTLAEKLDFKDLYFCFSSADVAAENVAAFNRRSGLQTADTASILNCIHKDRAYAAFTAAGVLNRPYLRLTEDDTDLETKLAAYRKEFPNVVVKPTSSSSSRGVSLLPGASLEQLHQIVRDTIAEFKSPVLVDRYIPGNEYSTEMLVDSEGNVMAWPIGYKGKSIHGTSETVSVKVIYNPDMDEALKNEMLDFSRACARATGLRNSLVHLEFKHAPWGGFYPMEIACRSSGYVASHLCDLVSDRSYLDAYADLLAGAKLDSDYAGENDQSSVYFFYDLPEGEVAIDLAENDDPFILPGFESHFINPPMYKKGDHISRHKNDDTKKAYIILETARRPDLHEEIKDIEQAFYVRHVRHEMSKVA